MSPRGMLAPVAPTALPDDEYGPNDHHWNEGTKAMAPGLGADHRPRRRAGQLPDPPAKAELRRQAEALAVVEREQLKKQAELEAREGKLREREADIESQMADLKRSLTKDK